MFYNPHRETGEWIDQEGCNECGATGIYVGPGEPPRIGNICWICDGNGHVPAGSKNSNGKPFGGRVLRNDVMFVRRATREDDGKFRISKLITYKQFVRGFLPNE